MREHTFSSKSWHFWLANFQVKRIWPDDKVDICHYIRCMLTGAVIFCFMTIMTLFLVAFFGFGIITSIIWFYTCLTTGIWVMPNPIAGLIMGCILLLAFGFLVVWIRVKIENVFWNLEYVSRVETPSFISTVYKKFKSKTCFMIGFTE